MKNFIICVIMMLPFGAKSQENICSQIELSTDKFIDGKKFNTPIINNSDPKYPHTNVIYYVKSINKGKSKYYLVLTTPTLLNSGPEQGVILLLKNGVKINKPKVDIETHSIGDNIFEKKSLINLTEADLVKLKKSEITDFRLNNDDSKVPDSLKYLSMLNCLITKN